MKDEVIVKYVPLVQDIACVEKKIFYLNCIYSQTKLRIMRLLSYIWNLGKF